MLNLARLHLWKPEAIEGLTKNNLIRTTEAPKRLHISETSDAPLRNQRCQHLRYNLEGDCQENKKIAKYAMILEKPIALTHFFLACTF